MLHHEFSASATVSVSHDYVSFRSPLGEKVNGQEEDQPALAHWCRTDVERRFLSDLGAGPESRHGCS